MHYSCVMCVNWTSVGNSAEIPVSAGKKMWMWWYQSPQHVFFLQWTEHNVSKEVTWCFMPSQLLHLYQGKHNVKWIENWVDDTDMCACCGSVMFPVACWMLFCLRQTWKWENKDILCERYCLCVCRERESAIRQKPFHTQTTHTHDLVTQT